MANSFDPLAGEQLADPYPLYRQLRDESPCNRAPSGIWTVSRYEDVLHVLTSPEVFSSRAMTEILLEASREMDREDRSSLSGFLFLLRSLWRIRLSPRSIIFAKVMIGEDGESHRRLRSIVNRVFTPGKIAAREPRVREIIDECLDGYERGEPFDPVRDLAVPLPVTMIAEMLGVDDQLVPDFKRWSTRAIDLISGPGRAKPPELDQLEDVIAMLAYLSKAARVRRRNPGEDLISALVHSGSGEEVLAPSEVVMFTTLLMLAGNETTTNLIGNASLALLRNPGELERLAVDPALIPGAVEESVRYDSPIQTIFREALEDTELCGKKVAKGERVALLIGSANHDERQFEDPERYDVSRNPQGHLGFGFGPHFCLGASLARLEGRCALERLVPILAEHELPAGEVPRQESFLVRGPLRLALEPR